MLSLDVGCGEIGRCDINCDIKEPDRIPENFVLCDSQKLPFRDKVFSFVETYHVIEHVKNPYLFLSEIKRVLIIGGIIKLVCPHRFSSGAKIKGHINYFDYKWFNFNIKYPFEFNYTRWSPFKFFLFFPKDIEITIFKG